jgi:putative membrane protein
MLTVRRTAAAAVAVVGFAAGPALTAHATAGPPAGAHLAQAPADITDAEFLALAARGNRFEIVTGRQAVRRGQSALVRRLGRQFVRHHTAALQQGAAVAAKLGIPVPQDLDAAQQATVTRLSRVPRRRFDAAWLRTQRAAHVTSVELHVRGALTGDSPDVRTLATLALPVVAVHLGELTVAAQGHEDHDDH